MLSDSRKPVALLAVAACTAALTGVAFWLIPHVEWGWVPNLVGAALFVLVVVGVRLLLDALESWAALSMRPKGDL